MLIRHVRLASAFFAFLWLISCASLQTPATHGLLTQNDPTAAQANTMQAAPVDIEATIDRIINTMTLDQKLGQLLMVEYYMAVDNGLPVTYNSYIDDTIRNAHAGGLLLYNSNPQMTIAQMQALTQASQDHADFPLLITLDQEGGNVNRLAEFYGSAPSAYELGQIGDPATARKYGALYAKELIALGINGNLAPVVDVGTINNVEGIRLWSPSVQKTDELAGAFLDGMQANGMPGALKHWPGIGSVTGDPHFSLPTVPHSLDQLNSTDFAAFKGLLPHGPAMIMVTDVLAPAVDQNLPATLSPTLVNGILRGQLGYQGVIITDSLHMAGIENTYNLGEAGVLAILAGDDILEGAFDPWSANEMLTALRTAVQTGRIPLSRIEESDRRILRLKFAYHIGYDRFMKFAGPPPQGPNSAVFQVNSQVNAVNTPQP